LPLTWHVVMNCLLCTSVKSKFWICIIFIIVIQILYVESTTENVVTQILRNSNIWEVSRHCRSRIINKEPVFNLQKTITRARSRVECGVGWILVARGKLKIDFSRGLAREGSKWVRTPKIFRSSNFSGYASGYFKIEICESKMTFLNNGHPSSSLLRHCDSDYVWGRLESTSSNIHADFGLWKKNSLILRSYINEYQLQFFWLRHNQQLFKN